MSRRFDVAVIGADTTVGGALLELLAERRFPVGELHALAVEVEESATVEFAGHPLLLDTARDFDFRQAQLAFLAASDEASIAEAERAADAGCVVVDAANVDWPDPEIPRVVANVNADALAAFNERGIVAAPDRLVVAVAQALAPLPGLESLRRVRLTALVPVTDAGAPGQEDLARETMALLNARHFQRQHFPQQIAFNVHGQIGDTGVDGSTERERRVGQDLRALLAVQELVTDVQLVQAPCFFGYAAALALDFEAEVDLGAVAAALRGAEGVELVEDAAAENCPSPVVDATRSAVVRVARLRAVPGTAGRALALWLTADNIRCAAALNAVRCAEALAHGYL